MRQAVIKEYGIDVGAFPDWNMRTQLDPVLGRSWWAWLRERDWLWSHFDAVDGAIGWIDRLSREGYWIEIVTSKPDWAIHQVYRWLGKWRPRVNQVTVVGAHDKKVDFTNAAILVDDKLENLLEFVDAGRRGIMFSRPHNITGPALPKGIVRANSWQEVHDLIRITIPTPKENA